MVDMAIDEPRLWTLIGMIQDYNVTVVEKYLEAGAEYMSFGEDLGLQHGLPISPTMWRKYIKPTYEAMHGRCRDAGVPVYQHTDGQILEIVPDLIEVGVRILNPADPGQWIGRTARSRQRQSRPSSGPGSPAFPICHAIGDRGSYWRGLRRALHARRWTHVARRVRAGRLAGQGRRHLHDT